MPFSELTFLCFDDLYLSEVKPKTLTSHSEYTFWSTNHALQVFYTS